LVVGTGQNVFRAKADVTGTARFVGDYLAANPTRNRDLDLLPLLMPAAEWRAVGQGLAQRAKLLNALLADLYGPATSVAYELAASSPTWTIDAAIATAVAT